MTAAASPGAMGGVGTMGAMASSVRGAGIGVVIVGGGTGASISSKIAIGISIVINNRIRVSCGVKIRGAVFDANGIGVDGFVSGDTIINCITI